MHRLLIILPLLVLTSCKKHEGAVKLTVNYSGFKPGCVRVIASDGSEAVEPDIEDVEVLRDGKEGALTVAIYRAPEWGSTLTVEAQAYERACPATGKPVTQSSGTVAMERGKLGKLSLELAAEDMDSDGFVSEGTGGTDCDDGDPVRYPEAPELCDSKDNDCDNQPNDGLGLGESCTQPGNCAGTRVCAPDGGVECNAPPPTLLRYWDGDKDGYGAKDAGAESFCNVPTGYSIRNDDCDDVNPLRYPSAAEKCNGQDDNCNDLGDEAELSLGNLCSPAGGCSGKLACDGDGGVSCDPVTFPSLYFLDDDRDNYGRQDGGVSFCNAPAGFVQQSGDCDDGNPFTHPSARELCDVADNNCDGANEGPGVCPAAGPKWVAFTVGTTSADWRSVSLWGDGGVWLVGLANRRAVKLPATSAFSAMNSNCDGNWTGVWADPITGRAFFGADTGKLAIQEATAGACTSPVTVSDLEVGGILGLREPGGTELHVVGDNVTFGEPGKTVRWDGGSGVVANTAVVAALADVHGLSRNLLFATGATFAGSPRLYRFDTATSDWKSEGVQNTTTASGILRAIWVVDDHLAFAVGQNGSVVRWNGTQWSSVPFTGTDDLSGVVAFGSNSAYAISRGGKIFRYDGTTWKHVATSPAGEALYDMAATSPEDIWVVGDNGLVGHWPK